MMNPRRCILVVSHIFAENKLPRLTKVTYTAKVRGPRTHRWEVATEGAIEGNVVLPSLLGESPLRNNRRQEEMAGLVIDGIVERTFYFCLFQLHSVIEVTLEHTCICYFQLQSHLYSKERQSQSLRVGGG